MVSVSARGERERQHFEPRLVSVPNAATMLGISTRRAWQLVSAGELESVLDGRRRLVVVTSIDERVARLRSGGTASAS
jgi:hypothetical protein